MYKQDVNEKKVLAARFRIDEALDVEKLAAEQGISVSDFLRRCVRNELAMLRRVNEEA